LGTRIRLPALAEKISARNLEKKRGTEGGMRRIAYPEKKEKKEHPAKKALNRGGKKEGKGTKIWPT